MKTTHGGRRDNTKRRPEDERGGRRIPGPGKKLGRPTKMDAFIKLLEGSEYGVEIPFAGAYMAYVSADDERGGYFLSFCKGEMPPHATDHADTAAQAAAKIAEIADLSRARLIEQ